MTPRWLPSFCVSLPNEFWELCAVVITTRCQLGNLYANGIGLGLIFLPLPQDLVAMGMPNSSSSHFYFYPPPPSLFFFFLLCRGKGHGSLSQALLHGVIPTGVKKRGRSVSEEVQLDFLNWCEVMIGSVLPDSTDSRRAQRLRWSAEGCFGQGQLTASHRDPTALTHQLSHGCLLLSGDWKLRMSCWEPPSPAWAQGHDEDRPVNWREGYHRVAFGGPDVQTVEKRLRQVSGDEPSHSETWHAEGSWCLINSAWPGRLPSTPITSHCLYLIMNSCINPCLRPRSTRT